MPVAAKLSRKLYETLGDEAAEAMVSWMDSVERNRAELREVADLGFARIDARFGEAEARIDTRFAEADARWTRTLEAFREEFRSELAELREEMHAGFSRLEAMILKTDARIDQRFADLLKWSFTFWIGSTLTLVGALVVLTRLAR